VSDDGKVSAAIAVLFNSSGNLGRPNGAWTQITHRNKGVAAAWGEAKSIHWKSDSYEVQGWLICPRISNPEKISIDC